MLGQHQIMVRWYEISVQLLLICVIWGTNGTCKIKGGPRSEWLHHQLLILHLRTKMKDGHVVKGTAQVLRKSVFSSRLCNRFPV